VENIGHPPVECDRNEPRTCPRLARKEGRTWSTFRELLELKGDRYYWKADYKEVFKVASEELYKTLVTRVRAAKAVNTLGADTEYWTQCANIVLRAKYEVLNK
jgi:hypothetical protein